MIHGIVVQQGYFFCILDERGMTPYLMTVFALARPKYSVIKQIQRVVEVRLFKAVAV